MREYIVSVDNPEVWDTLWPELTTNGLGDNFVPQRAIEVLNERPFNDFCAHFNLTDEEAEELKNDPRIKFVELQADLRTGVFKEHTGKRTSTFDKSYTINNTMKNWGLLRCTTTNNPFASTSQVTGNFTYNLTGKGVDIIVVDSGVEPGHPEFAVNADGTGGTRVVDFNWASLNVPGTPTSAQIGGYLGDGDGHGSNCASIAAGNTCGWAPDATIYSLRIFAGYSIRTGQYLGAVSSDICFDIVRAFHLKKLAEGNTRPTICTNSWGYRASYWSMTYVHYQGNDYPLSSYWSGAQYGMVNSTHPYSQVEYLNQSATNCANAGVILVGAAGNYWHKIDVPGGPDYDNYYAYGLSSPTYYHRGSSPTMAPGFINVGALDNNLGNEQKVYFSESGPRVDIYSPGVMIMGAYANKPYQTSAVPDPRNPQYYLNKISGTSQATPQVTGVLATALEANPKMTPAEAKGFLTFHSVKDSLTFTGTNTYANYNSIQYGKNRILKTPYVAETRGRIGPETP